MSYTWKCGPGKGLRTVSDHPLLIGAILARAERRAARRAFWCRFLSAFLFR